MEAHLRVLGLAPEHTAAQEIVHRYREQQQHQQHYHQQQKMQQQQQQQQSLPAEKKPPAAHMAVTGLDVMHALRAADVRSAFEHFLLVHNQGRPFILAAHGQVRPRARARVRI